MPLLVDVQRLLITLWGAANSDWSTVSECRDSLTEGECFMGVDAM